MPVRLNTTLSKLTRVPNDTDTNLLTDLDAFMKGNGASDSHRNNILKTAMAYANFLGSEESFYDISTRDRILAFLNTKRKDITVDPDKKWITTWNDYLSDLKYLFRWLYNYRIKIDRALEPISNLSEWETPPFVQIKKIKTNRLSPYAENEIWELDELRTIMKYEQFKHNKAALALTWDLSGRDHEVTLLRLKNIRLREKYGEGEVPHEAKTGSGPILLTFSCPYVRDWLNEHPFRNTPESRLICNLITGAAIKPEALWTMMKQLRKRIIRLLDNGSIDDPSEEDRLRYFLRTKKWNPYCIRHSSITFDSDYLPEYALKKKARWSMNSKQGTRYIKNRMGEDLKQKILLRSGVVTETQSKSSPSVLTCGRCNLINALDCKFCSSCSYPLTALAFEEIKEADNERIIQLQDHYEQKLKSLKEEMKEMNYKINKIFASIDVSKMMQL